MSEFERFLKEMKRLEEQRTTKKITTTSGNKERKHQHYPQGKTGFIPRGVGINPRSEQGRNIYYK